MPSEADDSEKIQELSRFYHGLKTELAKRIVGQADAIRSLMICLLARGHCLLVGVPGLAKTLLVRSMGEVLGLSFSRVQFTPDLMPSDITGTEVIQEDRSTGERVFRFVEGPIFANMILADELNRTPPKTQAALLEAMQEHQVTAAGRKHSLPDPFFVLATQNPIEQEGTYPLPEAQLDRFMFQVSIDYPTEEEELDVILNTTGREEGVLNKIIDRDELCEAMGVIREIPVAEHVAQFALKLVRRTRPQDAACSEIARKYVTWGAGPRGGQCLLLAGKANAALDGRIAVEIEDIVAVALPALAHRIRTNFAADAEGVSSADVVRHLLEESGSKSDGNSHGIIPNLFGSSKSR